MTNLLDTAKKYEPKETKNISDLEKVSVELELFTRTGENDDGKSFSYDFITVEGEDYRVPVSVIKQLKTHLEENPKLKFFKVKKEGSGMKTNYTVIPITE